MKSSELKRLTKTVKISRKETAQILGISERTLYYWLAGRPISPLALQVIKANLHKLP